MDTQATYDSIERLFRDNDKESPKESTTKKRARPHAGPETPNGDEQWISWREWQWRQGDRIFDEDRRQRGLRPMGAKYRQRQLESFLQSETAEEFEASK